MTWSKTKTAVAATVAVLLTAGAMTLVIKAVHVLRLSRGSRVAVYQPIPDQEPEITARVRGLKMEELREEDCTPEFWRQLQESRQLQSSRQSENPEFAAAVATAMGPLRAVTLVERTKDHGRPSYLYRMEYQNMNALFRIVFDGDKIAYAEGKPEPK